MSAHLMQTYAPLPKDKIGRLTTNDLKNRKAVAEFGRKCDHGNITMLWRDTFLIDPGAMRQLQQEAFSKRHFNQLTRAPEQAAYKDPNTWPNAQFAQYHATLYQNTAAGATSGTQDTQTKATALARAFPHTMENTTIATTDDISTVVHEALRGPLEEVWPEALIPHRDEAK